MKKAVLAACKLLNVHQGLIDKWCLNLLSVIMMVAGVQRPQVYWQLQNPTDEELSDIEAIDGKSTYGELKHSMKKRKGLCIFQTSLFLAT